MLIVTLPQVHQTELLKSIIEDPGVGAVRYNSGTRSAFSPKETIRRVQRLARAAGKPLYVDLKGKQLRVTEWANLPDGPILLNHKIEVELPAKVYFRNDEGYELREVVNGDEIFVDPIPQKPVGRGQAVNILAKKLVIKGHLLDADYMYIKAALAEGVTRFMLSFVESWDDIKDLEEAIAAYSPGKTPVSDYSIVCKIESEAGLDFVQKTKREEFQRERYQLMAARDDLMVHIGAKEMPDALRLIIDRDRQAICASRLLMGLEQGAVSMADVSDIELMRLIGYHHFMLCDNISREHSKEALGFLQEYDALK